MVILGIDPGLAHTGWGVVEEQGGLCRARAYGCISTTAHDSIADRLGRIYRELCQVVKRYYPKTMAIEEIFFGRNTRSAIWTAHARGAALVAGASCNLEVGEYTPMQIKQAVTGTGSADKQQVSYMVRQLLALDHEPKPDHAADALAVAVCHAHFARTFQLARSARQGIQQVARSAQQGTRSARQVEVETS